jgi:zinc protease
MNRLVYPLLLAGLLAGTPAARGGDPPAKVASVEGVTEYRLPNGLRVLLVPDQSKPILTVNMVVLVGSRHEGYGETGMAHLLEHMLCKGTPTHPDMAKELRDRGARNNATTWVDRTNFFETLPASDDNLDFAIRLEADRLVNCFLKREQFLTEMSVVRNEFERWDSDAELVLVRRMMAAAFEWHNYGKWPLGNRADLERVPIDNLEAFYKKHYRVDNAVLIVAGQFDEAKALGVIADSFGKLKPPARPLPPTYTREPAQDGERQVVLRRVGSVGAVGAVYHIPARSHPDYPAVRVLRACLTNEPAGRLYKALVETKKATGVSGVARGYCDPGVLEITASVADAAGVDAAREALIDTLESLPAHPITDEEVARVRDAARAADADGQNSASDLAHALGEAAAVGDWRLEFFERDQIQQVTAADVNRVAATYLTRNNRTVGSYHPTAKPERVEIADAPDLAERLKGYTGRAAAAAGPAFDATPENIDRRTVRGRLGGLKTAFLPKPTRGNQVIVHLRLRYGNEESLAGRTTAAEFLPDMLLAGTKAHTRQQIEDELNRLGAGLAINGAAGLLTMTVTADRAHLPEALALAAEVLREPTFPEAAFATAKAAILAGVTARKTDPGALAVNAAVRKVKPFRPEDVRYVPTIDESVERVRSVTLDDVKAVYAQVGAGAGELVAVGDFDLPVVTDGLEPTLAGWESPVPYRRIGADARPVARGERIVIDTPDKANAVYFALATVPMTDDDPDFPAAAVGAYLLGGDATTSRLGNRVRREAGLSYGIDAAFSADSLDRSAAFAVSATTNPANMPEVEALVAEELAKFLKDGPTAEELAAARKTVREQLKMALTSDGGIAGTLANNLFLDRTFARMNRQLTRLDALTPEDVRRAVGKVLDPAKVVIAEAGDFQKK